MAVNYQELQDDLNRITDTLDKNLHQHDLHKRIDLFYYIQKGLEMKLLMNLLKAANGNVVEAQRDMQELHRTVMTKWESDKEKLQPEKKAGWSNF